MIQTFCSVSCSESRLEYRVGRSPMSDEIVNLVLGATTVLLGVLFVLFIWAVLWALPYSDEIPAFLIDGKTPTLQEQMKRCHEKDGTVFLDDAETYKGCMVPKPPCDDSCKV